ncbi:MAG TPA: hypothetical protein VF092_22685 [Longimicrobium sp.]
MGTIFMDVSTYQVYAYGGPNPISHIDAAIVLPAGHSTVSLVFYHDGAVIPANTMVPLGLGNFLYTMRYRYAQFANVLDLLRNEKPIRFYFDDQSMLGYITTSDEPIGEAEV